jgi:flagellar protein FlgJ
MTEQMTEQQKFIDSVLPSAINIQKQTRLPAAAMVAQACLETGYGKYVIKDKDTGRFSYNLFGIKGKGPAGGAKTLTTEYKGTKPYQVVAEFRAYHNYEESFADYAKLITQNSRYARAVAVRNDPVAYAEAIQNCGYATDPEYAKKLINIMSRWGLINQVRKQVQDYRRAALDKLAKKANFNSPHSPDEPLEWGDLAIILERLGII